MSQKYRQHGYQDRDRERGTDEARQKQSSERPVKKETFGPRALQMPGTHTVSRCAQCGTLLTSVSEPLGKCPKCGFTQADFKKAGRLGCADCYNTFAEGLEGLLKTMHKSTRHAGKIPEALRVSRDNSERLKVLQKSLSKAIEGEQFEEAARLRDEISQMSIRASGTPAA